MKTLLEAGQVVPVVDRSYLLGETAEAFRYLGEGHAQGKVVIIVADDLETFEATTSLELNTVESIWVGM
jgi:hypothetical protein